MALDIENIRLLFDYNTWANHRALDACVALSDEQFTHDLGSGFRSVRDTLAHICGAEWLWLERWLGNSPTSLPPAAEFPNLDVLRARWEGIERNLRDYVARLKPEDLARIVHHKTTQGVPQAQPLWQMLQHVVNHGTYHRGQIATMLRQLGAKPISTDLIVFYRERAAEASA